MFFPLVVTDREEGAMGGLGEEADAVKEAALP